MPDGTLRDQGREKPPVHFVSWAASLVPLRPPAAPPPGCLPCVPLLVLSPLFSSLTTVPRPQGCGWWPEVPGSSQESGPWLIRELAHAFLGLAQKCCSHRVRGRNGQSPLLPSPLVALPSGGNSQLGGISLGWQGRWTLAWAELSEVPSGYPIQLPPTCGPARLCSSAGRGHLLMLHGGHIAQISKVIIQLCVDTDLERPAQEDWIARD